MNTSKTILITIFALILIAGLSYYFIYLKPKPINTVVNIPEVINITDQQAKDILTATSSAKAETVSNLETQNILNRKSTSTNTGSVINPSQEEILKILNKTN